MKKTVILYRIESDNKNFCGDERLVIIDGHSSLRVMLRERKGMDLLGNDAWGTGYSGNTLSTDAVIGTVLEKLVSGEYQRFTPPPGDNPEVRWFDIGVITYNITDRQ